MTQSRHTVTPAKTLLATQLNATRALSATLHSTQLELKSTLETETDQDLIAATQSILNSNRNHINLLNSEIDRMHSILKNWDQRKHNYQEKNVKVDKMEPTLHDKIENLNSAINQKRTQYRTLSEEQRVAKISKRNVTKNEYSILDCEVNSNKKTLNYLQDVILRLKSQYDMAHENWFQSTKV